MRESVELARKNWKGSGDSAIEKVWYGVKEKIGSTEFLGYENDQSQGIIKCLLKNHKEVSILVEDDEGMQVVLRVVSAQEPTAEWVQMAGVKIREFLGRPCRLQVVTLLAKEILIP